MTAVSAQTTPRMTVAEPHIADIPIIDLSVLHKGNVSQAELDEVVKQVRFACENIGFFQIVNHGVSLELQRAVFQASRKFFELPMSEKMAMKRDPYGNRGYEILGGQVLEGAVEGTHMKMQSGYSGMDLKEVHYIGKERAPGDPMLKKRFNGLNKLPPAVPEFPMVMAEYYDTMYDLAVKVMEVIALYSLLQEGNTNIRTLGLDKSYFMDTGFCVEGVAAVRLLRYPPQQGGPPRIGAGAHTDFAAVTLLMEDGVEGLQIWDSKSSSWADVKAVPGIATLFLRKKQKVNDP